MCSASRGNDRIPIEFRLKCYQIVTAVLTAVIATSFDIQLKFSHDLIGVKVQPLNFDWKMIELERLAAAIALRAFFL